jgi:hypothetical protein
VLTKSEFKKAKRLLLNEPSRRKPTREARDERQQSAGRGSRKKTAAQRLEVKRRVYSTGPLDLRFAENIGRLNAFANTSGTPRLAFDLRDYEGLIVRDPDFLRADTVSWEWRTRGATRHLLEIPYWPRAVVAASALQEVVAALPNEAASFTRIGTATDCLDAVLGEAATGRGPRSAPALSRALRRLRDALPSPVFRPEVRRVLEPYFQQHDYPSALATFTSPDRRHQSQVSISGFLMTADASVVQEVLQCDDQQHGQGCQCEDVHLLFYYSEALRPDDMWQCEGPRAPSHRRLMLM